MNHSLSFLLVSIKGTNFIRSRIKARLARFLKLRKKFRSQPDNNMDDKQKVGGASRLHRDLSRGEFGVTNVIVKLTLVNASYSLVAATPLLFQLFEAREFPMALGKVNRGKNVFFPAILFSTSSLL